MGRGGDDTTHVSCFAIESSFTVDATLLDLVLLTVPSVTPLWVVQIDC